MDDSNSSTSAPSNPLVSRVERIPFDQFKADQIEPAIDLLLARAATELEALKKSPGERTFDTTMRALDELGIDLDYAMGLVSHIESVATTPEWRQAYNTVLPRVSEFHSKIVLDDGLWAAIKEYAHTDEAKALREPLKRYVEKTVDDFRRSGADLPGSKKEELARINTELAEITNRFSQNALDATNEFEFITTSKEDLRGLPESALTMGRTSAAAKQQEGWRFTLQAPSYIAVMTYLDNRSIREKFYRAYNARCIAGPLNNIDITYRILELRRAKAALLGFNDFSDLILSDRMAKKGERAEDFVNDLRERIAPHFRREQQELLHFMAQELKVDTGSFAPWDAAYYAEKMRKAHYDFDEEELRPYFALPKVMEGLFQIVDRVFGIRVTPTSDMPVWAPGIATYSALDSESGELIGHFYADLFPRENKRSGAWMNSFITHATGARDGLPHTGLICGNFTPPANGKPALLTHDEVTTLFHEFGHLMHLLCSKTELRGQSMNGVAWDFIELPSQILENWCWERESLDLFARHVDSGEPLPETLFQKIVRARNFRSGSALMRQLGFSLTDLKLHRTYDRGRDGEIIPYTRSLIQEHTAAPLPADFGMIATFTHLFSSSVAYASGYYSYQWAEVLDADAFSRFKKEGLMNPKVGREFRSKILSRGDTKDPEVLFRDFMGRGPSVQALLERAGLTS